MTYAYASERNLHVMQSMIPRMPCTVQSQPPRQASSPAGIYLLFSDRGRGVCVIDAWWVTFRDRESAYPDPTALAL